MKSFVAFLSVVALLNLSVANQSFGGPVKKQPLEQEEIVALYQEQTSDSEQLADTEAGLQNGYGLIILLMAAGIGYLIYDAAQDS